MNFHILPGLLHWHNIRCNSAPLVWKLTRHIHPSSALKYNFEVVALYLSILNCCYFYSSFQTKMFTHITFADSQIHMAVVGDQLKKSDWLCTKQHMKKLKLKTLQGTHNTYLTHIDLFINKIQPAKPVECFSDALEELWQTWLNNSGDVAFAHKSTMKRRCLHYEKCRIQSRPLLSCVWPSFFCLNANPRCFTYTSQHSFNIPVRYMHQW